MSVLQLRDILLFTVPIMLACAVLWGMHWYPWNRGTKPLGRVEAYTMGTAVVTGAPVLAMLIAAALEIQMGELFWAAHIIANTAACGTSVKLAYSIDKGKAIGLEDDSHGSNY